MPTIRDFEELCPGLKPQHIAVLTDEQYSELPESERKNKISVSTFIQNFDTYKEENIAFFINEEAEQYLIDNNLMNQLG